MPARLFTILSNLIVFSGCVFEVSVAALFVKRGLQVFTNIFAAAAEKFCRYMQFQAVLP